MKVACSAHAFDRLEEAVYALDHRRSAVDSLAPRIGQLLHHGWIYPHIARAGYRRSPNPADPGPKSGCLKRQLEEYGGFAVRTWHATNGW